jgi:pre-mRNA-splicing factor ATP-dependent RNA helicase DHX16
MPAETAPEMQRVNLTSTVLMLKSLGIDNLLEFDFPDPPPAENLSKALESLYALGALSASGEVTKIGRQMGEFPLDPMLSKAIITAEQLGCTEEVCSIVAMLDVASEMWYRPKDKKVHADAARRGFTIRDGGDMLSILNVWEQWVAADYSYVWARQAFIQPRSLNRARDVRDQLIKLIERVGLTSSSCGINDVPAIKKAMVAGFFLNSARLQRDGQSYRTTKNPMTVYIHPSSALIENTPSTNYKWVCYYELVTTSKDYMRQLLPVTPELLADAAPHYHKMSDLEKLGVDKKMPKGQGKSASEKL